MIFNSIEFIIFLFFVWIITYWLNSKNYIYARNIFLLIASWGFYGYFNYKYLILLGLITCVNYAIPLCMHKKLAKKKLLLVITIVVSIGILATMKYAYLYNPSIILPVGLSFFTFQALSYSIDVYRGKINASEDFVKVALFISFLPTILSGPIERATNLFPQLEQKSKFKYTDIWSGITLFVWGLFKKVVIADRLAIYVDEIYAQPNIHTGSTLALAAFFYSIQIYCDFSGYADMAIGTGRILGFNIMENFKFPYFSTSIKSFWKKWHISLTSWFTEYVYFSLGGNRVVKWRWIFNILCIFILSGIWHGATTAFIIWGLMHALAYLIEYFLKVRNENLIYGLICFVIITLAWIFFRIDNFNTAIGIVVKIFTNPIDAPLSAIGGSSFSFYLTAALVTIFFIREYLNYKNKLRQQLLINIESSFFLILIALFGVCSKSFVYFQF